jgi:hypothetical protein
VEAETFVLVLAIPGFTSVHYCKNFEAFLLEAPQILHLKGRRPSKSSARHEGVLGNNSNLCKGTTLYWGVRLHPPEGGWPASPDITLSVASGGLKGGSVGKIFLVSYVQNAIGVPKILEYRMDSNTSEFKNADNY